jgi:hypothetical protein
MAIDFPSPATAGDVYTYGGVTYTYTAQGAWQGGTTPPPPTVVPTAAMLNAGRLEWTGATGLIFRPYNGDSVRVNGVVHPIPSAGISIPATGLTANTTYLVGLDDALAPVFATSLAHASSTVANNVGTEVMGSNTGTTTVIGMIRTDAAGAFVDTPAQRFVRSWFNSDRQSLVSAPLAESTSSTSWVEITSAKRVEFVKWAGELVDITFSGNHNNNTAGQYIASCIGIDNATPVSVESGGHTGGGFFVVPTSSRYTDNTLSEGYHYAAMLGIVTTGTGTWSTTMPGSIGPRLIGSLTR